MNREPGKGYQIRNPKSERNPKARSPNFKTRHIYGQVQVSAFRL
jgi:hypothetical protein